MSLEAECNSEVDRDGSGIPVVFPISGAKQNTQTKILSDTRTGILGSIAGPCGFLLAQSDDPTNFKESVRYETSLCYIHANSTSHR
jgi:hypothetical protein